NRSVDEEEERSTVTSALADARAPTPFLKLSESADEQAPAASCCGFASNESVVGVTCGVTVSVCDALWKPVEEKLSVGVPSVVSMKYSTALLAPAGMESEPVELEQDGSANRRVVA